MAKARVKATVSGAKIDESRYALQATRFIYEGNSDQSVARLLKERYGFDVSVPCVMAFRHGFYEKRLKEMLEFAATFKEKQLGQVRTYIDKSMEHAERVEETILDNEKQLAHMTRTYEFTRRFEAAFMNAVDSYFDNFDPDHPTEFMEKPTTHAEMVFKKALETMGHDYKQALQIFVATRNSSALMKARTYISDRITNAREVIVGFHKDIFKSYRNYSILQEITLIFEEYNGIIIENFFSNRANIDKEKYARVKQQISALYDKLQIRYQSVEAPSASHGQTTQEDTSPTVADIKQLQQLAADGVLPKSNADEPTLANTTNHPPSKVSKTRTVVRERERIIISETDNNAPDGYNNLTKEEQSLLMESISERDALALSGKLVSAEGNELPSDTELTTDLDSLPHKFDAPEPSPIETGNLPPEDDFQDTEDIPEEEPSPEEDN